MHISIKMFLPSLLLINIGLCSAQIQPRPTVSVTVPVSAPVTVPSQVTSPSVNPGKAPGPVSVLSNGATSTTPQQQAVNIGPGFGPSAGKTSSTYTVYAIIKK